MRLSVASYQASSKEHRLSIPNSTDNQAVLKKITLLYSSNTESNRPIVMKDVFRSLHIASFVNTSKLSNPISFVKKVIPKKKVSRGLRQLGKIIKLGT